MANCVVQKPVSRSSSMQSKSKNKKKGRPLPPGQKLLIYAGLSAGLVMLLQGGSIRLGKHKVVPFAEVAEAQPIAPPINLTSSLDVLQGKLEQASDVKDLRAGIFVSDQQTGRYVDVNGHDSFSAASMIKVPVFVALLEAVDKGRVNPDQMLEIRQDLITGGSGWLQWRPIGSKLSVRDTADLMITISDNTATNMLIDLLGGKQSLNREFVSWGLERTRINNMLGDFEGTNTTSPYDLVYLMARIDRGELLNPPSKQWMYQTMARTRIRTLLPPGLGPGAHIAHKTGDIASMVGDCGIVTLPSGAKYFVSVQVERPHNDRRANMMIRSLSKMIYDTFSRQDADGSDVRVVAYNALAGSSSTPPHAVHHHHGRHHRHA